jgi:O-antigen ligase
MQWINKDFNQILGRDVSIRLARFGIPFVVLMLSLFFSQRPSPIFILLPIAAALGLVVLRHPYIGIFGILPIGLYYWLDFQRSLDSRINSIMIYTAMLVFIWIFDMVVNKRQIRLISHRAILVIVLFCVSTIISFLMGQLPWYVSGQQAGLDAQIGQIAIFMLSAGIFLVVGHQVQDLRILKTITWVFLGTSAVFIFVRTVPGLDDYSEFVVNSGATGSVYWIWLLSMSFSQAMYNRKLALHWRWLMILLTVCSIYVSFVESRSWVSGWLPAMISVIVIILVVDLRFGLLAGLGGLVIALPKIREAFSGITTSGTEAYSYFTRLEAWKIVLEIVRENWLLGLGPANYYYYTPLFPILGNYVTFNSHNQYIDLIAQVGIIGLVLFLWFFLEMFGMAWWLKSRVPDGFARAYVFGSIGAIVGMLAAGMLGDWVLPFVYNVGTTGYRASVIGWLFLGGLFALNHLWKKDPALLIDEPASET